MISRSRSLLGMDEVTRLTAAIHQYNKAAAVAASSSSLMSSNGFDYQEEVQCRGCSQCYLSHELINQLCSSCINMYAPAAPLAIGALSRPPSTPILQAPNTPTSPFPFHSHGPVLASTAAPLPVMIATPPTVPLSPTGLAAGSSSPARVTIVRPMASTRFTPVNVTATNHSSSSPSMNRPLSSLSSPSPGTRVASVTPSTQRLSHSPYPHSLPSTTTTTTVTSSSYNSPPLADQMSRLRASSPSPKSTTSLASSGPSASTPTRGHSRNTPTPVPSSAFIDNDKQSPGVTMRPTTPLHLPLPTASSPFPTTPSLPRFASSQSPLPLSPFPLLQRMPRSTWSWSCETCTFDNALDARFCTICEAPGPLNALPPPTTSISSRESQSAFPSDVGDIDGVDGVANNDDDLDSLIKAMTPHDLPALSSSPLPLPNRPPSSSFPYGPYQMIDNGGQINNGSGPVTSSRSPFPLLPTEVPSSGSYTKFLPGFVSPSPVVLTLPPTFSPTPLPSSSSSSVSLVNPAASRRTNSGRHIFLRFQVSTLAMIWVIPNSQSD
jgi:hypothetical protein